MIAAVDTNILLDLLIPNAAYVARSRELLYETHNQGRLIISEAVYAELAGQFAAKRLLDVFLLDTGIRLEHSTGDALHRASVAWQQYAKRRPLALHCPQCGRPVKIVCANCQETIRMRQHILTDFLVGAHAEVLADCLLSRDRGHYRRYFPTLKVLS
jgi:hypothetical protein